METHKNIVKDFATIILWFQSLSGIHKSRSIFEGVNEPKRYLVGLMKAFRNCNGGGDDEFTSHETTK